MRRIILSAMLLTIAASPGHSESQDACQNRIQTAAIETGVIVGYKMEGSTAVVQVNERIWNRLDFNVKSNIADTWNCAIAGPGKTLRRVEYISNISGKILHLWDGSRFTAQ